MADISLTEKYKQQYAHFGRMNDVLYKIPPLFATVIGGLWFFAASYIGTDKIIAIIVFTFAACCCACFFVVMYRFRLAFNAYIDRINVMDGDMKVSIKQSRWPSTIRTIMALLIVCLFLSIAAAIHVFLK
jgi:hypothetical protein